MKVKDLVEMLAKLDQEKDVVFRLVFTDESTGDEDETEFSADEVALTVGESAEDVSMFLHIPSDDEDEDEDEDSVPPGAASR